MAWEVLFLVPTMSFLGCYVFLSFPRVTLYVAALQYKLSALVSTCIINVSMSFSERENKSKSIVFGMGL